MKNPFTTKDWQAEYDYFLESPECQPSPSLTSRITTTVVRELDPSTWGVFCRLFAIHFISGAITLFFCPQLDVALHGKESFLFYRFSLLGEYGCMIACGALFLGATGLVASILLSSQEVRVIRKTQFLKWVLLAFLSLGFFLSFRESENAIPLGLVVAWIAGALAGGFFSFNLGLRVRNYFRHIPFTQI